MKINSQIVEKTEIVSVRQRLIWLLVFRAVVMAVLLVFSILVAANDPVLLSSAPQGFIYLSAGLAFFVILSGAIWQHFQSEHWLGAQILLQQIGDLIVGILLVFATGGLESTFVFWFSLTTINGAALAYRVGAVLSAAGGSLGLALLAVLAYLGIGPAEQVEPMAMTAAIRFFLFNVSALFIVALLSSYLSEQLRQTGKRLIATQDDLSRLESLHSAVLSSLTSGLMVVDARKNLSFINRAGASLLKKDAHAVKDQPLKKVAPELFNSLEEHMHGRGEVRLIVEGHERIFGCSVSPLLLEQEQTGGQVLTFQDLTDLRELEDAMARSKRMASLGRFAAGLAHELRNPLASLSGCVELLSKDDLMRDSHSDSLQKMPLEQKQKLFAIVLRESERLNTLLTDFLHYARPKQPAHRPLLLNRLVQEIVSMAQQEIHGLVFEVDLENSVRIQGDKDQLSQLVWNLLRNAMQSLGEEGKIIVSVNTKQSLHDVQNDVAVLQVEDDGPGISQDIKEKVLEPFFTTRNEGTGLGLPTVLRISESHGGQLDILESRLGGALFRVSFPLLPAEEQVKMLENDKNSEE